METREEGEEGKGTRKREDDDRVITARVVSCWSRCVAHDGLIMRLVALRIVQAAAAASWREAEVAGQE